ncbi:MAG: helix-turn-helix transcriptional regulator [Tepidiformaceae bacterium]
MAEPMEALSVRELEVLALLAHGKENKEIAAELGLKPTTVRGHLETIYLKLLVTNRVEATVEWLRLADTTLEK